jgi:hypothetical protein
MQDTKFMTAIEKEKVLKHWKAFLKSGFSRRSFTKLLYHHLMQNCSFIAHYNIHGFYGEYFGNAADTARFLRQFDRRYVIRGDIPESIEGGDTYWATGDYTDINTAMIDAATEQCQRWRDH